MARTWAYRFNPRTRVGCDMICRNGPNMGVSFQSTHPRGVRRQRPAELRADHGSVSIHAPAWGATAGRIPFVNPWKTFQSTHPRGVRRGWAGKPHCQITFQSTHPRGVRLVPHRQGQGARWSFNPRTRVGATCPRQRSLPDTSTFQSTHPRGVRPYRAGAPPERHTVSIHAPAWGATSPGSVSARIF